MNKPINILDKDYLQWVKELCKRYRQSQIKAAVKVNHVVLQFYWDLGKDICNKEAENKYGSKFYATLSRDLRNEIPDAEGLSERNLRYTKKFYQLYNQKIKILQQIAANSESEILQQPAAKSNTELASQELAAHIMQDLFSVPWGHQMLLIDKCSDDVIKALFYVQQVVENGWSRNILHNYIDSSLYERQGKALSNFTRTLPEVGSDLAQEITRDPYNFAFTGITKPYNERILKDALLNNITKFLTELGTGFAYVGKEYRLQIGEKENFIDLLFYNLNLSCYIVLEVKIGSFTFADVGQLGGYVVACNHLLRKEGRDNPTIGLLICKEKDRIQAQYALESSSQPIAISEYDLEKFYPEKLEGTMPTIEEWEAKLGGSIEHE
ncbi:YhcG family protein [Segatella copri]|uniref:PDDEXK nuclease domain-containing protein n=1 Tax=Segatella copri TaxID=165179 RepID=UPI0025DACE40|nr:PDDEXK nuclease domain-containing protein [Segatella copri]MDV3114861.1 PDDEXK nuclease domain-containing protein [Segatella copri]WOF88799.1 PDDEXK nuclease domain-containing protein [Segatella copri]WOF94942.1 PDDEXK nuclease domain-containing protein [Segatella copri]